MPQSFTAGTFCQDVDWCTLESFKSLDGKLIGWIGSNGLLDYREGPSWGIKRALKWESGDVPFLPLWSLRPWIRHLLFLTHIIHSKNQVRRLVNGCLYFLYSPRKPLTLPVQKHEHFICTMEILIAMLQHFSKLLWGPNQMVHAEWVW